MKLRACILFIACITATAPLIRAAQDDGVDSGTQPSCVDATKQTTNAMLARDWPQLREQAQRMLQACGNKADSTTRASAYKAIASADRALKLPTEALAAANACIGASYDDAGCHIERAQALLLLDQRDEARASLVTAEHVAQSGLDAAAKSLDEAGSDAERDLATSRLDISRAEKNLATQLREEDFPEKPPPAATGPQSK
ncbi:MAG TPA: hypothetical protein VMH77_01290 [Steroidobacteraceae bacterium]|nr:hypothetical protein [Steroidobacteraceae bacterium]